ncbi:hypothetical protein [Methylococcus sp. EFPC2]|uniref:hypothetical protein n=1 Tax=Methylococcus sp. EFPC2 TaxID=2812648 RepID=UPI001966F964|nr:hypothetical protein [Methylococcus sp. EFPC2]QSA97286.1 hypothetical protein JWZ97_00075 [Methylococcus sp. EFPC2]
MDYYDALSDVIRQSLFIVPFALGRQLLTSASDSENIIRALVVAGIVYSLPMLFEVRMSPQLHTWIYGYFPHSFLQQMRDGGFRPVVFLGHGLWVAFFAMTAVVGAATLWQARISVGRFNPAGVLAYLSVVLLLCKSMASMLYAAVLLLFIRFTSVTTQLNIARCIVLITLLYPMLRAMECFPVQGIEEMAASVSKERAQSLKFRLDNEEILLARARERAFSGWGSWGRNRVYDEATGDDLSVTDGRWIIVMGQYGWFGYIAEFGLLALPVFRAFKASRYVPIKKDRIILGALSLILAISLLDLLVNASVTPWTWLIAGSLLGRCESINPATKRRAY